MAYGGGGGGAVEIGATGTITDFGAIFANGGNGESSTFTGGAGGGGSGGLIFLHAPSISDPFGGISANGGAGGSSSEVGAAGGGGGGGFVDIMTLQGGFNGPPGGGGITANGAGNGNGGSVAFELLPATPEPSSIFLLAAGLLGLPALLRFARNGQRPSQPAASPPPR